MLFSSYPAPFLNASCSQRNRLLELKISLRNADLTKTLQASAVVPTKAKAVHFRVPASFSLLKRKKALYFRVYMINSRRRNRFYQ